ncbi:MAG: replication-associated recombination protein A [Bifidobacteriaceae bacterium]|jgi:putative ATPase|nr:replication-associated recombination protein A [Bifidobacteriaceae bacterium]
MRPRNLGEFVGQSRLLAPGSPLRRLIEETDAAASRTAPASVILWGPAGTGKTTLAYLVARGSGRAFTELSAVSAGVRDIRAVLGEARRQLGLGQETVLFIDEVHRFSKAQQDALLPAVENRTVTLIAATTENPSFSVITPLLSRSLLLTLEPLDDAAVTDLVDRAVADPRGLDGTVSLTEAARGALVRLAGGDARKALTILEAAAGTVALGKADPVVDLEQIERAIDVAAVQYDRDGDQHYDVISAFIKSVRGSDVDAALHYLARMIAAGEDPRFIARRIIILAAEDVGMADPSALLSAIAAAQALQLIGMPEARIPLAEAVIHLATAPKSNASYLAIDAALADVRAGLAGPVPRHLRDAHYPGAAALGHGDGYRYAHDYPRGIAPQVYAPDAVQGREYYRPTDCGFERQITERLAQIKPLLRGPDGAGDGDGEGPGPADADRHAAPHPRNAEKSR